MEIIKDHKKDFMKSIVKGYRGCGHEEYYGMIYNKNGLQFCRQCIYEIWQKESNYEGWKPDPNRDFVFPIYEDGINYSIRENEYKEEKNND